MKIAGIEQVLTRTKFRLRLTESTLHDSYLEILINEGASHLGSLDSYRVSCGESEIDDCGRAELPEFSEQFLAGRFIEGGCNCGSTPCSTLPCGDILTGVTINSTTGVVTTNTGGNSCGCPIWYVNPSVFTPGIPGCIPYPQAFDIQGNTIQFPTTCNAQKIQVYCKSMNVDENGIMVIYERWERGLSAYAASQFSTDYPERYTRDQRDAWAVEWVNQKKKQRAKAGTDRFQLDKGAIRNLMNAIITNNFVEGSFNVQGFV